MWYVVYAKIYFVSYHIQHTTYNIQSVIVGIDEAGRGPLAGPVVAGACHIPMELYRRRKAYGAWSPNKRVCSDDTIIGDSKALSGLQREKAYNWITQHCAWGFGIVSAERIDKIGILEATNEAMKQALSMLSEKITPTYLLVDGRDAFWFDYPHTSIIKGDDKEACIAAGSIIAKVTRDRLMIEASREFPQYGFEGHKGYGSAEHIAAIKKHGPCEMHRRSFLRNILNDSSFPQKELHPQSVSESSATVLR